MKILPVFGCHLEFLGEGITIEVGTGTAEKLTIENMGIAFGILSLGGTEPEIHLGVIYLPPNCNVRFKTTIATVGLNFTSTRYKTGYFEDALRSRSLG